MFKSYNEETELRAKLNERTSHAVSVVGTPLSGATGVFSEIM